MDYGILVALSAVCTALTGTVIGVLKIKGDNRIATSWMVALILCFAGVYSGFLPKLCEPLWLCAILETIGVGLMANGWADQKQIKKILDLFYPKKENQETAEVTIEAEAPEKDTPMARIMKLQSELGKYIKVENGKVKLTIKE